MPEEGCLCLSCGLSSDGCFFKDRGVLCVQQRWSFSTADKLCVNSDVLAPSSPLVVSPPTPLAALNGHEDSAVMTLDHPFSIHPCELLLPCWCPGPFSPVAPFSSAQGLRLHPVRTGDRGKNCDRGEFSLSSVSHFPFPQCFLLGTPSTCHVCSLAPMPIFV